LKIKGGKEEEEPEENMSKPMRLYNKLKNLKFM